MKIATYNIMSGGFETYSYELTEPKRLELIKKAIKTINADVIGLIDTFRWDQLYTNSELSTMLGYKYVYCINLEDERLKKIGHNNGITILSNIPLSNTKTIRLYNRNAIKISIKSGDNIVDIFIIYLDDRKEETRIKQTKALLECVSNQNSTILMGDFNTLNSVDVSKTMRVIHEFVENNPKLQKIFKPMLSQLKKSEVIQLLTEYGFIDIDPTRQATYPTKLFRLAKITNALVKVDHVMIRGNITVKNFQVLKDSIFDKASDHYPICFEVDNQ